MTMPLRGLAVLMLVLVSLPLALAHPFVGILTWNWLAYMNPHRQTWGALENPLYRLALWVAVATLVGVLLSRRGRLRFVRSRDVALVALFFVTLIFSTLAAYDRRASFDKLVQYAKIFLMCYVMICVVRTERRFRILTWTTALFVCLIGIKGVIVAVPRGFPRIFGPPDSFLEDNNDYALAMNMMLPLFWAMAVTATRRGLKVLWYGCLALTAAAVLFTYSRGGFLGLGFTVALMAWKGQRKTVGALVLIAGLMIGMWFAPDRLRRQIKTLTMVGEIQWDEDKERAAAGSSAQDRIRAWRVAIEMAKSRPLTGVGLRNFRAQYRAHAEADIPDYAKVAHSAYFHILGEAGYLSLLAFVAIMLSALLTLRGLRRRLDRLPAVHAAAVQEGPTGGAPDYRERQTDTQPVASVAGGGPGAWTENPDLAADNRPPTPDLLNRLKRYVVMCEVSIMSYAVTAAFLSRADFDLYFQVVAMAVMLREMVRPALAGVMERGLEAIGPAGLEPAGAASAYNTTDR